MGAYPVQFPTHLEASWKTWKVYATAALATKLCVRVLLSGYPEKTLGTPGCFPLLLEPSVDDMTQPLSAPQSQAPPMRPSSESIPPSVAVEPTTDKPPMRFLLTALQLCALGTIGWIPMVIVPIFMGIGLGTLLLAGIGALFLVAMVYILYAVGWFETVRVDGLYRLDAPPLLLRPAPTPGFGGWIRSLGRQLAHGRMWVAAASFGISAIIGASILSLVRTSIELARGSRYFVFGIDAGDSLGYRILLSLLCLAVAVGLVFLARIIAIALVGSAAKTERLSSQAEQATEAARQSAATAQASSAQRSGAMRAADLERTRIERDLHDGIQPRLVSVGMTLGLAKPLIDTDPTKAKQLVAEAHTSTKAAITELRQLARGIHASVLDDRGLDAALSALASRSAVPVFLDVRMLTPGGVPVARVSREAETAVYFAIAESLTNAAKHSKGEACRVTVRLRTEQGMRPSLWARVEDNGVGGATIIPGGGLDGILNRITAAGGSSRLDSPNGGPTSLEVRVPCEY